MGSLLPNPNGAYDRYRTGGVRDDASYTTGKETHGQIKREKEEKKLNRLKSHT
jgi:hypothetical protein